MSVSSSDSEDDYYCNAAQKLQKLKNKYQDDNMNTSNLLNDSKEAESSSKSLNSELPIEVQTLKPELSGDSNALDEILAKNAKKRVTRASAKKKDTAAENLVPAIENAGTSATNTTAANTSKNTNSRRGRGRGRGSNSSIRIPCGTSTPSPRGRRRGRNRNIWNIMMPRNPPTHHEQADIPTFSVGNTYEYPDMSDNQELFSSKPQASDDVVVVDANDSLEENEELSVKVYWQNSEFFKFVIRRFQKFSQIFDYFSKKENVTHEHLLFTFNDHILRLDDTPDSINYSIVKYIDGGIVNDNVSKLTENTLDSNVKNGIKIKFQCQNVKKPFETVVSMDEKFSLVLLKYSEHIEKPLNKLKFQFDGDTISGKSTPRELEFEGGECIDVIILS